MLKFLIPAIVIAIGIAGALLFLPEPEIADRSVPPQPRERAESSDDVRRARAPDSQTAGRAAVEPRRDQPTTNAEGESEPVAKTATGLEAPKVVPTFDVVRVTRDGNAVIAGRAEPGATVTVLDQGLPLGTVTADPNGEWVLIPQRQLDAGARASCRLSRKETAKLPSTPNKWLFLQSQTGKTVAYPVGRLPCSRQGRARARAVFYKARVLQHRKADRPAG